MPKSGIDLNSVLLFFPNMTWNCIHDIYAACMFQQGNSFEIAIIISSSKGRLIVRPRTLHHEVHGLMVSHADHQLGINHLPECQKIWLNQFPRLLIKCVKMFAPLLWKECSPKLMLNWTRKAPVCEIIHQSCADGKSDISHTRGTHLTRNCMRPMFEGVGGQAHLGLAGSHVHQQC